MVSPLLRRYSRLCPPLLESLEPRLLLSDVSWIQIGSPTLAEGNSGTADAVFTLTRGMAPETQVWVDYATSDGSATAGSDYTARTGTVFFDANQTTAEIRIPIVGDTDYESDENFWVNLSNPQNATISIGWGLCTIQNDDVLTMWISDVSVPEGNSGVSQARLTVSLSATTGQTVSFDCCLAAGTATEKSDYGLLSYSGYVTGGQTTSHVDVMIQGDTIKEGDETLFVNIFNATYATITDAQGQITILNDDTIPTVSIDDVEITEGDSGTANAVFHVSLCAPTTVAVQVDCITANVTDNAHAPEDYIPAAATLNIPAGETETTFSVTINGDRDLENDEIFYVHLSSAVNAVLGVDRGTGTIVNDDRVTAQVAPYAQDFFGGRPGAQDGWEYYYEGIAPAVASGTLELASHSSPARVSEAILHLDLAGWAGVTLRLDHDAADQEANDTLPASFAGHANGDGISFSPDGVTWHKLADLTTDFTAGVFDLDAAIAAAGVRYTADFRIKFSQYDTSSWPTRGRRLDNIAVAGTAFSQAAIQRYFNERQYLTLYPDVAAGVSSGALPSGLEHFLNWGLAEGRNPSAFFSNSHYLQMYPVVQASVNAGTYRSGFEQYLLYGASQGRSPSAWFQEDTYLAMYSDVASAVEAGTFQSGFEHYMLYGAGEGRDPSAFFRESYYRGVNGDVAAAIGTAFTSGAEHYVLYGGAEGRNPCPLFQESFYRGAYTDVTAGGYRCGLEHYVLVGAAQHYSPSAYFDEAYYLVSHPLVSAAVTAGLYRSGFEQYLLRGGSLGLDANFNEENYLDAYRGVHALVNADVLASGRAHYLRYGGEQNRYDSPLFDEEAYLTLYADVAAAVAAGSFRSGLEHFALYGQFEGRNGTFNEWAYLDVYSDVKAAVLAGTLESGLAHYAAYGRYEGRQGAYFDEAYYLATYTDVASAVAGGAFQSGLEHYILFGQFEGRSPRA